MAYFAKINSNNFVEQVICISNCSIGNCIGPDHWDYQEEYHKGHTNNIDYPESEVLGQQVLLESGFEGTWLQTSFNNNFRGRFASPAMAYNPVTDEFFMPGEGIEPNSVEEVPHTSN